MKKFLIKSSIFLALILSTIYFILIQADGNTDPLYLRFTTPPQSSLIIGTSRAAQALMPGILNDKLLRKDIYNFAFTLGDSPYGPTYFKSIEKKLNPSTKNGLFILSIDPWSICSGSINPNDSLMFEELTHSLAKVKNINSNPNFSYLLNSFNDHYFNIIKKNNQTFLHKDGWLEVNIDMDSTFIETRIDRKLTVYKNMLKTYKISNIRIEYLIKTIEFLKQHGNVYLVRLPVHRKMMELENTLTPNFDSTFNRAINISDGYFDMTYLNSKYIYLDGNHLYKKSGEEVTRILADWIIKKQNSNCIIH